MSIKLDVKYALFNLFQAFGQVVQIVCKRNHKMRGQAFVVFKDVGEATAAKNNLNGYPIFGKPMVDIDPNLEHQLLRPPQQSVNIRLEMIVCIIHLYAINEINYAEELISFGYLIF